jgi:quinol---cytochrome c reductase cytochrome c subunit, bacillus type
VSSLDQRRAGYKRYKQDVARHGKPFFPPAMFHDTVMSLVVVCVIIALACIWKYTGLLGVHYTAKADPGTTSFVPRPDWYFYFLFYLLRIFKWPETVIIGTIGIPTICLVLLLGLPFVDTRMERRLSRRPVAIVAAVLVILSMGVLTWKGATAKEALGSEVLGAVPDWAQKEGFAANEVAVAGAELFAQSCTTCHTYLGAGSSNYGAPDLSAIGASGQGVDFFERYVSDPSQFGNTIMPKFGEQLSKEQIHQIAVFLDASKGAK